MPSPQLRIGIDTGGTFTDVVALDAATGEIATVKVPSTPGDPGDGFFSGLLTVLERLGADVVDVVSIAHGTTVATNALLADDFPGLGLVTTLGFRHVLEIARQSVPDGYGNSYFWVKPERIVPLHRVVEVDERLGAAGEVVRLLDEASVVAAARSCRAEGLDAVGVCLLHSYVNPAHEERVLEIFEREAPEIAVSISTRVLREYREYERSVTTLVDAFVKRRVSRYIAGIDHRISDVFGTTDRPSFYVMKSNGGVMTAQQVSEQAVATILSGPAAGVLGGAVAAASAGFPTALTLDGGGTSTDVAVVSHGEPQLTTEGAVGRHPVKVPMLDVVTVGTGGGSIAWVSPEGSLKVGPRSAGADPGPACYGRGGVEATVTDAHLFAGRIPAALLGGRVPLDRAAAGAALEKVAREVGLDVERGAAGVLEIAAWNQANAIRRITVERGLDARDFTLCAFGGSGPLLACRLVDLLGLAGAVVPRSPGTVSAFGLLCVDARVDQVLTIASPGEPARPSDLAVWFEQLERHAVDALDRQGFPPSDCTLARAGDLRYAGQASELLVPLPAGRVTPAWLDAGEAAFHEAHERLYGYSHRGDDRHPVEWVTLRVTGIGALPRPRLAPAPRGTGADAARAGTRPLLALDGWRDAAVFARDGLGAGDELRGPAIVEEFGSTIPVEPGFLARVDAFGNVVLEREDR